jgi:heterodisulfide reductase subunit C
MRVHVNRAATTHFTVDGKKRGAGCPTCGVQCTQGCIDPRTKQFLPRNTVHVARVKELGHDIR